MFHQIVISEVLTSLSSFSTQIVCGIVICISMSVVGEMHNHLQFSSSDRDAIQTNLSDPIATFCAHGSYM